MTLRRAVPGLLLMTSWILALAIGLCACGPTSSTTNGGGDDMPVGEESSSSSTPSLAESSGGESSTSAPVEQESSSSGETGSSSDESSSTSNGSSSGETTGTIDACENREIDRGETDVDCGGRDCDTCDLGQQCEINIDCTSEECNADGICVSFEVCATDLDCIDEGECCQADGSCGTQC